MRCGVLETYENYDLTSPDARIIEVAFGIVPAKTTPAAPDPIVVFIGGPGGSALVNSALGLEYSSYSGNRDVILVDQRGTGYSSPFLDCEFPDDDDGEFVDSDGDGVSDADAAVLIPCLESFENQGVDLSQYRSAVIAQDFKVLREALQIAQWNVYGVSYGPIPGLLYADLDPAGVRSVIFDSSTDNQVDIMLADTAAPLDYISELASQCAAEPECAARIPDLRSVFIETFRSLMNEPWIEDIPGKGEISFAGYVLFDFIRDLYPTEYPGFLEIFANRDAELLAQILFSDGDGDNGDGDNGDGDNGDGDNGDGDADNNDNPENRNFAVVMSIGVQCAAIDAENFYTTTVPTLEQWPDDILEVVRNDIGSGYPNFCKSGLVSIEQDLTQRTPRSLSVPALIFGGRLDPLVAVQQVEKLTESFTSPRLAMVPKGGHGVVFPEARLNACTKSIAAAFLDNPEVAPDMSCLTKDIEPFVFDEDLVELFRGVSEQQQATSVKRNNALNNR